MTGLPPMEPPSYTPRSIEAPGLRPMDASTYSPRGQHGPDMVDLAPATPWSCWNSEYQPPPPPAFASPVEAELALSGNKHISLQHLIILNCRSLNHNGTVGKAKADNLTFNIN